MKHLTQKWKLRLILAALVLTFLITKPDVEKYGDSFQIALPVIAAACAVTNGQAADFAIRYVVMFTTVHSSKRLLNGAKINQRPRGGIHGMPSGHTATAVFGASTLVHQCIQTNVWVKGLTIITAGFVGGTRIAMGAHDIWQVLIGALIGWISDRAFRGRVTPFGWIKRLIGKIGT